MMRTMMALGLALAFATSAQAARKAPRRVVVATFDAPSSSRARNAVLETLSDHNDVEVVSLDDVEFISKRYKIDPATPEGRKKISSELSIDLWIDGKVSGLDAHMTLSSGSGRRLTEAEAHGATESLLDVLAGEKMWTAMGPRLSRKEHRRRALLAQQELARTKISDRQHELDRQRTVALEREDRRLVQLKEERDLARKKQAAIANELARQTQLVQDRIAQQTKERQEADERRRREEMRRLAQIPLHPTPAYGYQKPAQPAWGASSGYGNASAYPAPDPGTSQTSSGVSVATQRWLESQQQGSAAPSNSGYGRAAGPTQPGSYGYGNGAPGYGANAAPGYGADATQDYGADPAAGAAVGGGVSPATQRWLEQQRQQAR